MSDGTVYVGSGFDPYSWQTQVHQRFPPGVKIHVRTLWINKTTNLILSPSQHVPFTERETRLGLTPRFTSAGKEGGMARRHRLQWAGLAAPGGRVAVQRWGLDWARDGSTENKETGSGSVSRVEVEGKAKLHTDHWREGSSTLQMGEQWQGRK